MILTEVKAASVDIAVAVILRQALLPMRGRSPRFMNAELEVSRIERLKRYIILSCLYLYLRKGVQSVEDNLL